MKELLKNAVTIDLKWYYDICMHIIIYMHYVHLHKSRLQHSFCISVYCF